MSNFANNIKQQTVKIPDNGLGQAHTTCSMVYRDLALSLIIGQ